MLFLISQVLFFRHKNQTNKNAVDTTLTQLILVMSTHAIILQRLHENNIFYQVSPVKLNIIMHAMSDSPILGFVQVTKHILNVIYVMNFSGAKFNQSYNNFFFIN